MDRETKLEVFLRTIKLGSYAQSVAQIDAAYLAFSQTLQQTHENNGGRRVRLTKQRKIAMYKAKTAEIFSDDLDISRDAIAQIRAIDRDA